ncbi:MAG: hypothetical protein E7418_04355 [Ruminococcaceae bacterium]|nr:hypothetical protein [Oscillospiraceae bacterium]
MTNIFVQGGVVAVIGICTVFVVLAILWGTLELMRVFFTKAEKKAKEPTPVAAPAATPVPAAPVPVASEEEELIAVLTAAVAACLGQPASRFNIKNYRRVDGGAPVWNRTARRDNLIG